MTGHQIIVGVGGTLGHDANAAVLIDGRVAAASQEERYSRQKYDPSFPERAIDDCLASVGARPSDVDVCVFADKPLQELISTHHDRRSNWVTWQLGRIVPPSTFVPVSSARRLMPHAALRFAWHHMCHATLAFATSPYEHAVFLCVDGQGDDVNATIGVVDSRGPQILHELGYVHGVGHLHSLITEYPGFSPYTEYKVMGLAPYGRPTFMDRLRSFARSDGNGALRFNNPRLPPDALWASLSGHLGVPARANGEPFNDDHLNLAASIQALFEDEIFKMAAFAKRVTGEKHLLFCGGCAQNCVAAGKLRDLAIFNGVFTSPAAGDAGIGLGAALLYDQLARPGGDGKADVCGLCLGSQPGAPPPEAFAHTVPHDGDVVSAAARVLAAGSVVGWVRGRMELGARALGARAILADPRVPDMQSRLNQKVKFRESFRPFAPAILAEDCGDWFDSSEPSDYMQSTATLRSEHRRATPPELSTWRERLAHQRVWFPRSSMLTIRPVFRPCAGTGTRICIDSSRSSRR